MNDTGKKLEPSWEERRLMTEGPMTIEGLALVIRYEGDEQGEVTFYGSSWQMGMVACVLRLDTYEGKTLPHVFVRDGFDSPTVLARGVFTGYSIKSDHPVGATWSTRNGYAFPVPLFSTKGDFTKRANYENALLNLATEALWAWWDDWQA